MIRYLLIVWASLLLMSAKCKQDVIIFENPGFYKNGFVPSYNFNRPDTVIYLDNSLVEISGLAFNSELNALMAINDEQAYVYYLDLINGEIIDKIDFGKPDDYEGITTANNLIYVIESNGNIKVVDPLKRKKVDEMNTKLSGKNDIEGITYVPNENSFYIAAKGNSRIEDNVKAEKAIFKMDITKNDIQSKPFLSINLLEEVKSMEEKHLDKNVISNLSISSRLKNFAPSGIAIEPSSQNIFVLSAKSNIIVILSPSGNMLGIIFLNRSHHVQAEGICFGPNGTLYISNEGRSKSGSISIFKVK